MSNTNKHYCENKINEMKTFIRKKNNWLNKLLILSAVWRSFKCKNKLNSIKILVTITILQKTTKKFYVF